MEARNRLLTDWFTRMRTRHIKLPRFQRHEAWTHDQISVFEGGLFTTTSNLIWVIAL